MTDTANSGHRRPGRPKINATEKIDVTFGAYNVGTFRVPYMSAILRLQQVSEYLKLVTDDAKYATQNWQVTELFQREVNQSRVIKIAEDYLEPRRATKPPFFNSLTVVLNYGDEKVDKFVPPESDLEYQHNLKVGPVLVSFDAVAEGESYPCPGTFGKLAWNRDQVNAVAIDGQHRLAALKELYKKNSEFGSQTYISVLFLVIAHEIGFRAKEITYTRLQWMRSIFIDLNKHAEPVSRARQLLLDDNDPTSRFVRELFSPCLEYIQTANKTKQGLPIGTIDEFYSILPLDLVDWHSEAKSKVDEGPYVTSILGLDWIVRKALLSDYRRADEPRLIDITSLTPDDEDYYDSIEEQLKRWKNSWQECIESDWKDCKEKGKPFILQQNHLVCLCNEFRSNWGRPVTRLLTTVGPYLKLAKKRVEGDTISPPFGQWYQAVAAVDENLKQSPSVKQYYQTRKAFVENELTKNDYNLATYRKTVDSIDTQIKQNSVFFLLVAQRAMFLTLSSLVRSRQAADWSKLAKIDLKQFEDCMHDFYAYYLAEALNAFYQNAAGLNVFAKDCLVKRKVDNASLDKISISFWAGSILDRVDPQRVDFGEAGAKRASKWFTVMAHLYWFLSVNPEFRKGEKLINALDDFDELSKRRFGLLLIEAYEDLDDQGGNLGPMSFLVAPLPNLDERSEALPLASRERIQLLVEALKDIS